MRGSVRVGSLVEEKKVGEEKGVSSDEGVGPWK